MSNNEDQVTEQDIKQAVLPVLEKVLPGRKAQKFATELARTVARTYPTRPAIEGDAIENRGTERDPLYRLIAATLMDIPDDPRPPHYNTRYLATLMTFDALNDLYSDNERGQSYFRR